MAAREGDEVLIGLLRRGDPRPQIGERAISKLIHLSHGRRLTG
jgi:hypothetical protein